MKRKLTMAIKRLQNAQQSAESSFNKAGVSLSYCMLDPYCGKRVYVHTGIQKLADIYGCELKEKERDDPNFPYEFRFSADGIDFIAISRDDPVDRSRVLYGTSQEEEHDS